MLKLQINQNLRFVYCSPSFYITYNIYGNETILINLTHCI